MSRKFNALGALLGFFLSSAVSAAAQDVSVIPSDLKAESRIEVTYGNASPPTGFMKFCERSRDLCRQLSEYVAEVSLSSEQWILVDRINRDVNHKIRSSSDQELYGQKEFWTLPTDAGDCEDYVLLKQKQLVEHGIPASALLITVVLDENGEGHAVLTVSSSRGDYILDNRRDEILLWSVVNYRFLKRQSPYDPVDWIALAPPKQRATIVASGNNAP